MSGHKEELMRSAYAGFRGLAEGGDVRPYVIAHYEYQLELRDVKELRMRDYVDRDQAHEAAGLSQRDIDADSLL